MIELAVYEVLNSTSDWISVAFPFSYLKDKGTVFEVLENIDEIVGSQSTAEKEVGYVAGTDLYHYLFGNLLSTG